MWAAAVITAVRSCDGASWISAKAVCGTFRTAVFNVVLNRRKGFCPRLSSKENHGYGNRTGECHL